MPDPFAISSAVARSPELVATSRGPSDDWVRERLAGGPAAVDCYADIELTPNGFVATTWLDLSFLEGDSDG